ncbi:hypothetical protein PIB30_095826 [Stylosanthes scabra]|uniref:Uncharacterized protein n=1 Tax=Stylosanthes scabra TaxID=79078 RepID=A0ABU6UVZ8_9FABA|nr:hypothetical protein [Stylosanthes scabra]
MLIQANLEQARSCLNTFKISSQAHTPSFPFGPRFLPSPNVTQGKASSPWSRFCHVLAWPKRNSNVTSPQAPQALLLFKQGHGNKDKQILNFDPEIERTLRKLRKQSK